MMDPYHIEYHSHEQIQSGYMSQYISGRNLAQMRVQYSLQSTHQLVVQYRTNNEGRTKIVCP